jgi:post-segregation antitoxin (ccd killing protein)
VEYWPDLADKNHEMYVEAAQKVLELQLIEELKARKIEIAREHERAIAREVEKQIAKELELEAIEQEVELIRLAEEEAAKPWWKKLFQRSNHV